jgi:hypothetical protein
MSSTNTVCLFVWFNVRQHNSGYIDVVSEYMMLNTMVVEDSAHVFCIAEELEWTLSRALRHSQSIGAGIV